MIPADPYRNLGPATILRADARCLPLADDSVDLIVTSPPYFALRSYRDGGEHYAGQIGSEATPAEFVDALIDCTREMVRVLKPSGSLWINLGDKYAGTGNLKTSHNNNGALGKQAKDGGLAKITRTANHVSGFNGVRDKSLLGIPWRFALRCIDDLGLILRAEVIWSKPNGLPESVTDRVRRSHEQWFHFTLQPRYFSAVDEIREEYEPDYAARKVRYGNNPKVTSDWGPSTRNDRDDKGSMGFGGDKLNPLGKLPGSVWTIPTQPLVVPDYLGVDHFAAFPSELPKRIIRGWSPAGVCTACGEGRRPMVERKPMEWRQSPTIAGRRAPNGSREVMSGTMLAPAETTITGYACACPEPTADTTPALILDPFGGTGTVAMVARALGRHGIHADLSSDYNRLARWRITDLDQLAHVQGHERTKRQPDTDDDLLTLFNDGGTA